MNAFKGDEGERGPTGDHGQNGETGLRGAQGRPGAQGPPGVTSRSFRSAVAALFLFMVAAGLLLGHRSEMRDHRSDVRDWEVCQARRANIARTNRLYEGIIAIEHDNPFRFTSPATVQRRIDLYTDAILTVPVCGPRP